MQDCKGCGSSTEHERYIQNVMTPCCQTCGLVVQVWLNVKDLVRFVPDTYRVEDEMEGLFLDRLRSLGYIEE